MAEDGLEGKAVVVLTGEQLDVAVQLLPVQLPDRPEQGLVEVGQCHLLVVAVTAVVVVATAKKAEKMLMKDAEAIFGGCIVLQNCAFDSISKSFRKSSKILTSTITMLTMTPNSGAQYLYTDKL